MIEKVSVIEKVLVNEQVLEIEKALEKSQVWGNEPTLAKWMKQKKTVAYQKCKVSVLEEDYLRLILVDDSCLNLLWKEGFQKNPFLTYPTTSPRKSRLRRKVKKNVWVQTV